MPGRPCTLAVAGALSVVTFLAGCGVDAAPASQVVPDQYIVVLRDDTSDPRQVAGEMAQQYGLVVSYVYEHAMKGFAARIPPERLPAVRADSRVLFVSEDRGVQTFGEPAPLPAPQVAEPGSAGEPEVPLTPAESPGLPSVGSVPVQ
jgi:hypothetical protein